MALNPLMAQRGSVLMAQRGSVLMARRGSVTPDFIPPVLMAQRGSVTVRLSPSAVLRTGSFDCAQDRLTTRPMCLAGQSCRVTDPPGARIIPETYRKQDYYTIF